jgi:hypothetical protein
VCLLLTRLYLIIAIALLRFNIIFVQIYFLPSVQDSLCDSLLGIDDDEEKQFCNPTESEGECGGGGGTGTSSSRRSSRPHRHFQKQPLIGVAASGSSNRAPRAALDLRLPSSSTNTLGVDRRPLLGAARTSAEAADQIQAIQGSSYSSARGDRAKGNGVGATSSSPGGSLLKNKY